MHLALNKATNDLYKPTGGGVTRVNRGRFVVQQVQCKLKTLLREWILDRTVGWIGMEDFEKDYHIFKLEDRARAIILNTKGVLYIIKMSSSYSRRELNIQFIAQTIYGQIILDVPWDNSNKIINIIE